MVNKKKNKKEKNVFFQVEKYRKYSKGKKIWSLCLFVALLLVVYSSYIQTFTLFVVFAWIFLFTSATSLFVSFWQIRVLNKEKYRLIIILQYAEKPVNLLELAPKVEYPYSILKQIVDYLEKTGEISI